MKIAVMAGTPIDTNMGAVLLEKNGFSISGISTPIVFVGVPNKLLAILFGL